MATEKKWRVLRFNTTSNAGTVRLSTLTLNVRIADALNKFGIQPGEVIRVDTQYLLNNKHMHCAEFLVYTDKFDTEELVLTQRV